MAGQNLRRAGDRSEGTAPAMRLFFCDLGMTIMVVCGTAVDLE